MSTKTKFLVVGGGLFVVGAIATAVCLVLVVTGRGTVVPYVGMLFAYAMGTLGLANLGGALTSKRFDETMDLRTGGRQPGHRGPQAGVGMSAQMNMSTDSPLPAILMGLAAIGLAVLTLLLTRSGMPTWAPIVGLLVAVYIAYWAYRSFRSYRKLG